MVAIGGSSTANIHMDIDTRYKIQGLLKIVHWQSVVIVASKAKIEGSREDQRARSHNEQVINKLKNPFSRIILQKRICRGERKPIRSPDMIFGQQFPLPAPAMRIRFSISAIRLDCVSKVDEISAAIISLDFGESLSKKRLTV